MIGWHPYTLAPGSMVLGQTEHKEMPRSQMKYKQSLLHAGQFSLASDYDLHSHVILV